jgi:hypothetical protein
MSVRQALRELSLRQVPVSIVGHGIVVRQEPAAGTGLPLRGACVLTCEPGVAAPGAPEGGTASAAPAVTAVVGHGP